MAAGAPYVELHAHSAFSFLDGASTPAELAGAAAKLGYPAFALTDHDGVWGSMEFVGACGEIEEECSGPKIRAITGAEVTVGASPAGDAHLTLLVEDGTGYRNLCRLLTAAHSHTRDSSAAQCRTAVGDPRAGRGARRRAGLPLGLRRRRNACRRLGAR